MGEAKKRKKTEMTDDDDFEGRRQRQALGDRVGEVFSQIESWLLEVKKK